MQEEKAKPRQVLLRTSSKKRYTGMNEGHAKYLMLPVAMVKKSQEARNRLFVVVLHTVAAQRDVRFKHS